MMTGAILDIIGVPGLIMWNVPKTFIDHCHFRGTSGGTHVGVMPSTLTGPQSGGAFSVLPKEREGRINGSLPSPVVNQGNFLSPSH